MPARSEYAHRVIGGIHSVPSKLPRYQRHRKGGARFAPWCRKPKIFQVRRPKAFDMVDFRGHDAARLTPERQGRNPSPARALDRGRRLRKATDP